MKFGIVIFPGSNCDHDMIYLLEDILNQEVVELWHKEDDLKGCDFIVLPGGFSYGDYLRSGAIASLSPIMNSIVSFANKGGYVMGICNGFQILTEAKLLDGALRHNNSQKFICKNQYITPQTTQTILTAESKIGKAYNIPIAHGEGNFYADSDTLKMLNDNDQVLFRYCDEKGNTTPESNPNGAAENIAGITNKARNVFGMMPHPERAADKELSNTDGLIFFESILKNLK